MQREVGVAEEELAQSQPQDLGVEGAEGVGEGVEVVGEEVGTQVATLVHFALLQVCLMTEVVAGEEGLRVLKRWPLELVPHSYPLLVLTLWTTCQRP